jgi:hypothetical protein
MFPSLQRWQGWYAAGAKQMALYITFDGFSAYQDAFEQAFSDRGRGQRGRTVNTVWPCLSLAKVIKHPAKSRFRIARYLLRGSCTMLVYLRTFSQGDGTINTAFIERLNGTFRA